MKKKIFFCTLFLFYIPFVLCAQFFNKDRVFTKADTLRGTLSPARSCYDVTYYELDLRVDTVEQTIRGSNKIFFRVSDATNLIQIDLFENMEIHRILMDDTIPVAFTREYNAVFIGFKTELVLNSQHTLTVHYGGKPTIGKLLPWDGGFKWTRDRDGRMWVGVACQGTGASLWWPNKDHQSDEPDSMLIAISVPSGLKEISNGRLRTKKEIRGGYTRYEWFVSYPINNYNVTVNIGNYAHFSDIHINGSDTLTLDYYVMPYNLDKAKKQFEQVNPMLNCFEFFFGKYPFYKDGYKLVETPYLGMEHQSCIAYGNKYLKGYSGSDISGTGLDFDYIIVHESAHEWWGNSITSKDIADMWIHEGFATYSELLYTLCMFDSFHAAEYAYTHLKKIKNDKPVIGHYGVNEEGSNDMYSKGMILLFTLSNVVGNDSLWLAILKGIQYQYKYQTVTTQQIESFISEKSGMDLSGIFNQYLRSTEIPVLEIKLKNDRSPYEFDYRWTHVVKNFNLPVLIRSEKDKSKFIYPTGSWQTLKTKQPVQEIFKTAEKLFYFKLVIE